MIKIKEINFMSNGKDLIIHLIAGLIKKMLNKICQIQFHCTKMNQCFCKLYEPFGGNINVKVDLSNYARKCNFKTSRGIDTFKLAAKSYLVNLKGEVDKLDFDKLKSVPTDLSNLKSKVDKLDIVNRNCSY